MIPGIVAGAAIDSGSLATLYSETIADSPALYLRFGDPSGTTATNEVGASGTYSAGIALAQTALYPGGLTCALFTGGTQAVTIPASTLTAATNMTLRYIVKPTSVSGFQMLLCRDNLASPRKFQSRMNGASLEFVKISGGVETISKASVFAANVTTMIHIVINGGAGTIKFYQDGTEIHSTTIGATDYGDAVQDLRFGYNAGGAAGYNGYASEVAAFPSALSAARVLVHAQMGGFA
ncbi:LamG domain-containing protein [Lysobacter sp. 5GHs7-4]|uniref:LamG domain-containing protein n=1 Tax=Lysobacter sp. 5GHs7-4 TaxID=2904253 RepID=UPI001E4DEBF5|nr:LamG domain-containing protein [Lysobacter sp. 5GHs7-4]UHQ21877.1 LamG domain-containing protein [Lysobacter sp. 5GHs7-4]